MKKNPLTPFVHLHIHTEYSILDGACRIKDLMSEAELQGMPAVAITDHDVMYGAVPFHEAARAKGIKPIIGCEMSIAAVSPDDRKTENLHKSQDNHLILLATNDTGYHNLVRLVSMAQMNGFRNNPSIDHEMLAKHSSGLIGMSACLKGKIPRRLMEGDEAGALELAGNYSDIFGKGNFFLEVQDHMTPEQCKANKGLIALAGKTGLGLVATNNVHYLKREHAEAHELMLCFQTQTVLGDPKRMKYPSSGFYFKSGIEMAHIFRDFPESITNTLRIAERCNFEFDFTGLHFPKFHVSPKLTLADFLLKLCREGLMKRYGLLDMANPKDYREEELVTRCKYEISIIEQIGFITYFLVVWDVIHYAKSRNIPVGPGRGAGAGSLVAYLLEITDIDPIRHGLIFERFINPDRVSPPAFDFDVCRTRRGEVIEYIKGKYGSDCFAQIIAFHSFGAKTVIREVGRVMELPFSERERLARMVPDEYLITLSDALEQNHEFRKSYETEANCKRLLDYGFVLEGLVRNFETYEGGFVIVEKPISEIAPLARNKEGQAIVQYPVEHIGKIGLMKIDLIGLMPLTVIRKVVDRVKSTRGEVLDIDAIPTDDKLTFKMLQRGDTVGVFQFESAGMREYLQKLRPAAFDELIALIALYHPGPMDFIESFINRKHGRETIAYVHPLMEPIFRDTYGYLIYQEQVQRVASVLAGFSLAMGDTLRRIINKRKAEEMVKMQSKFVEGCAKINQIPKAKAVKIFNWMVHFTGFGVNKAHCTAYSMVAFKMAYLKAHYPKEFKSALRDEADSLPAV